VDFVVVGDSITAGTSPVRGAQQPGAGSWIPGADAAPLVYRGGWAVPGSTSTAMREGVAPQTADVVVVMAGTNDVLLGVPWETSRANLITIVGTVGVADVVLSTIPPLDPEPALRQDYNGRLRALAAEQGWDLVDPWTDVDRGGGWAAGATIDGVHQTPEVGRRAGVAIRAAVLDAARD